MSELEEFNTLAFEKRLQQLKDTQESIQSLSAWCLKQREHHKKIVQSWLNVLKRVKIEQRLVLFYLANDVIQYSKRKNYDFVESWGFSLQKATPLVRDEKVRPKILRIFKIWEQRSVYDDEFLSDLTGLLSAGAVKKTDDDSSDFQPQQLVNKIKQCADLDADTDQKMKNIHECTLDLSDADALCLSLKERRNKDEVEKDLNEGISCIEKYTQALQREIVARETLLALLTSANQYYSTQRGEVKVVAYAYKNFGARVRALKRKLDELIPSLPSVAPSPPQRDEDVPSPGPDEDLDLPNVQENEEDVSYNIDKTFSTSLTADGSLYNLGLSSFLNSDNPMSLFNDSTQNNNSANKIEVIGNRTSENQDFNINDFLKNLIPNDSNHSDNSVISISGSQKSQDTLPGLDLLTPDSTGNPPPPISFYGSITDEIEQFHPESKLYKENNVYRPENKPYVTENRTYGSEAKTYVTTDNTYATETKPYVNENKPYVPDVNPYRPEDKPYIQKNETYLPESKPYDPATSASSGTWSSSNWNPVAPCAVPPPLPVPAPVSVFSEPPTSPPHALPQAPNTYPTLSEPAMPIPPSGSLIPTSSSTLPGTTPYFTEPPLSPLVSDNVYISNATPPPRSLPPPPLIPDTVYTPDLPSTDVDHRGMLPPPPPPPILPILGHLEDVDHRLLPAVPPPLPVVTSGSRHNVQQDVDHRNLISLTHRPGMDQATLRPGHPMGVDQDYRVAPMIPPTDIVESVDMDLSEDEDQPGMYQNPPNSNESRRHFNNNKVLVGGDSVKRNTSTNLIRISSVPEEPAEVKAQASGPASAPVVQPMANPFDKMPDGLKFNIPPKNSQMEKIIDDVNENIDENQYDDGSRSHVLDNVRNPSPPEFEIFHDQKPWPNQQKPFINHRFPRNWGPRTNFRPQGYQSPQFWPRNGPRPPNRWMGSRPRFW